MVNTHPDVRNLAFLRNEARSVAAKYAEPFVAWSELKRWSLGKGPAATTAAVMEFMEQHGRSPESASILPEIAGLAVQMPEHDRKQMLELANHSFSLAAGFRSFAPVPRVIGTPFPNKKDVTSPAIQPDIARMMAQRDMIFHVNRGGLEIFPKGNKADAAPKLPLTRSSTMPKLPLARTNATPKLPLTRENFASVLGAGGHGHALLHSLAEKLSMHGHDERHEHHAYEARAPKRTTAGRRAAKKTNKTAKKNKTKPRHVPRRAKKPVLKARKKTDKHKTSKKRR